jgi:hypothetical protein
MMKGPFFYQPGNATTTLSVAEDEAFFARCFEVLSCLQALGESVAVVGGLAVMMNLGFQHRRTFDLDLLTVNKSEVVARLSSLGAKPVDAAERRYLVDGGLAVDIDEVGQQESSVSAAHLRLAQMAREFAWGQSRLRRVRLMTTEGEGPEAGVRVADVAGLTALKAWELVERRGANADEAGADAFDLALFCSNTPLKWEIVKRLRSAPDDLADLVAEALEAAFVDASVVTAAALRLSQRAKLLVKPSDLARLGLELASSLRAPGA